MQMTDEIERLRAALDSVGEKWAQENQRAEKAEAELADVKVKWMGQIGQCATLSTQIDRLEAERDALLQTLREIADADNMSIDGACAHARHTLRTVGKMGA